MGILLDGGMYMYIRRDRFPADFLSQKSCVCVCVYVYIYSYSIWRTINKNERDGMKLGCL